MLFTWKMRAHHWASAVFTAGMWTPIPLIGIYVLRLIWLMHCFALSCLVLQFHPRGTKPGTQTSCVNTEFRSTAALLKRRFQSKTLICKRSSFINLIHRSDFKIPKRKPATYWVYSEIEILRQGHAVLMNINALSLGLLNDTFSFTYTTLSQVVGLRSRI
jgi:hypothetical protein